MTAFSPVKDQIASAARMRPTGAAGAYLKEFAAFIELVAATDRHDEPAAKVRDWRPPDFRAFYEKALAAGLRDDFADLSPISRRAFVALAGGLVSLAAAAQVLPPIAAADITSAERAAQAEIATRMRGLLARAFALIDAAEGRLGRGLAWRNQGAPAHPGEIVSKN